MKLVQRIASAREQTLDRVIRIGLVAVVVGAGVVGVVYYVDQQAAGGQSVLQRKVSAAEDAVRQNPSSVGQRLQLAEAYRASNKIDSALEQYNEVLKVQPKQRAALLGRGEILAEQGDLSEAEESFNILVRVAKGGEFAAVDPQLESAYYGIGSAALMKGHIKTAIASLRRAVKVNPTDADALQLLGVAHLKADAPGSAVKVFRKAVVLVPTGWCEPYQNLSVAYRALGRRAQAEHAGAMVDFCQKKPDDAARRLKQLTSGPAAVDAMLGLGMIAEAKSDRAGAIRYYKKVLVTDAANSNARMGLNRLGVATKKESPSPEQAEHGSNGVSE